ncbi:hypothetical protein K8S17_03480 [bacterium]|nr:hypothetical protein [bacterium]
MARTGLLARRWPRVAAIGMVLGAVVSWVIVLEDGPSDARILSAVAMTVGSVISIVRMKRGKSRGEQREV